MHLAYLQTELVSEVLALNGLPGEVLALCGCCILDVSKAAGMFLHVALTIKCLKACRTC
jgi:hypothetical protein